AVSSGCCAISARVSRCRSRPHLRGIRPSPPQSSPSQRQAMEADMSDQTSPKSRREALRCLALGGAGTLFALAGGVFTPVDLAVAATDRQRSARAGKPLFVQISDTHIGFNKHADPDVGGNLARSVALVSANPRQLAWVSGDLEGRSASTPIVVFAHMPLWTIHEPWGWGTGDAPQLLTLLRRFGSVTVLNGHIHQIVQKVEGHVTFHTARSTAYPQ